MNISTGLACGHSIQNRRWLFRRNLHATNSFKTTCNNFPAGCHVAISSRICCGGLLPPEHDVPICPKMTALVSSRAWSGHNRIARILFQSRHRADANKLFQTAWADHQQAWHKPNSKENEQVYFQMQTMSGKNQCTTKYGIGTGSNKNICFIY